MKIQIYSVINRFSRMAMLQVERIYDHSLCELEAITNPTLK